MKTKVIFLVAITAIVTFSFTFTNIGKSVQNADKADKSTLMNEEPLGGFVSEDRL